MKRRHHTTNGQGATHPTYIAWAELLIALDRLAHNMRAAGYDDLAMQIAILRESLYDSGPRRAS